jgi:hypothetical protein
MFSRTLLLFILQQLSIKEKAFFVKIIYMVDLQKKTLKFFSCPEQKKKEFIIQHN